jgi:prepilin-type N-terminal cleavage/methylation domain-containing protein
MKATKAFTLIELLVVIAIIAILAAILFPVFAQAKVAAKKAVDQSNVKQITLGTIMYTNDYDDTYPLEAGKNCDGSWKVNSRALVPANFSSVGISSCDDRVNGGLGLAQNTTNPYIKNYPIFQMPGATQDYDPIESSYFVNPVGTPAKVSYTFNGLLGSASATSMNSPASVPIWWPGFSQAAGLGYSYAQPFLICSNPNEACMFTPLGAGAISCPGGDGSAAQNGTAAGFGTNTNGTVWCFSKGEDWGYADGHVKFRILGSSLTPSPITDPWSQYDAQGVPLAYFLDTQCMTPLFRPDYQP